MALSVLMPIRVKWPAVDALVSLATYNYDESILGVEGEARDPFWAGTYILIIPAAYAPDANIRYAVEALCTVIYDKTVMRLQFTFGRFEPTLIDGVIGTEFSLLAPRVGTRALEPLLDRRRHFVTLHKRQQTSQQPVTRTSPTNRGGLQSIALFSTPWLPPYARF